MDIDLAKNLIHVRKGGISGALKAQSLVWECPEGAGFGSTTENAPPGEAGRFWGYYREERTAGR
jgi:hypothetical protein